MSKFLEWYNLTSLSNGDKILSRIARAGIAHLWFEVIHPFDDGNGRVGRAIADHALSQSLGYPTTACLATAIEADKKSYYLQLEKAGHGSLNVDTWLDYFADQVIKAQEIAREEVDFVLAKTRFYEAYGDQLNDRQGRMVCGYSLKVERALKAESQPGNMKLSPSAPIGQPAVIFPTWLLKVLSFRYQEVVEPRAMS